MRSSNSASREYDSFNPSHQAIYRPLTVVGWKPYRMTLLQRIRRTIREALESAAIFVFRTLPNAIGAGFKATLKWSGSRIQKPGMATVQTVQAVAAKVESKTTSQPATQQIRL